MSEFEIYRSQHNPAHYVALAIDDDGVNARRVRESGVVAIYTTIPDDDSRHIGFDPVAARAAIGNHGFYAFTLFVEERDGLQELGL